ncbi:MAG: DUF6864 domain-containing function [Acinetobacter amyesii]|uniref:DUF6864 domain-containing function n=1 Tax=Acinetobacter amyesii TaxID=2942470 RepID=UPI003D026FA8
MTSLKNRFNIRKVVDEMEVIDTGVLHTRGDLITFYIDDFKLEFKFIILEDSSKPKIQSEIVTENGQPNLIVKLYNFNNPLGSGFLHPTEIVEMRGAKIFLTFFLRYIEGEREFTYSLLCK